MPVPPPIESSTGRSVAGRLAAVVTGVLGDLPVRIRAWDGSEAGPVDAPVVVLRSRRALRRCCGTPTSWAWRAATSPVSST